MAKQIEFTAKNVKAFTSWIKKFSLVDKSLLLEINEPSKEFIAKTYNEERSVVKYSKIRFDQAGFILKKSDNSNRIKVGIYDIGKLIKTIEHFGDEFSVIFRYEELLSDNTDPEFAASSILLKNKDLKIVIECTSLNIFKYITDDLFLNQIAKVNSAVSFSLNKENIEKVNSLSDLDKDYKFLEFINKDKNIYVRSKTFELLLGVSSDVKIKIDLLKDQFSKIDIENYSIELCEDRMLFKSSDTDTISVVSMVEKDDRYEEKVENLE